MKNRVYMREIRKSLQPSKFHLDDLKEILPPAKKIADARLQSENNIWLNPETSKTRKSVNITPKRGLETLKIRKRGKSVLNLNNKVRKHSKRVNEATEQITQEKEIVNLKISNPKPRSCHRKCKSHMLKARSDIKNKVLLQPEKSTLFLRLDRSNKKMEKAKGVGVKKSQVAKRFKKAHKRSQKTNLSSRIMNLVKTCVDHHKVALKESTQIQTQKSSLLNTYEQIHKFSKEAIKEDGFETLKQFYKTHSRFTSSDFFHAATQEKQQSCIFDKAGNLQDRDHVQNLNLQKLLQSKEGENRFEKKYSDMKSKILRNMSASKIRKKMNGIK